MAVTIKDPHVAFVFHEYPLAYRRKLLQLRKLILKTSKELGQIQDLVETLKWGEPSYASRKRNIGTTVRIHWLKSKPDQYGIYFYCQTKMIAKCKKKFGNKFNYEGNRALIFKKDDKLPLKELKECIRMAFTYYLEKN